MIKGSREEGANEIAKNKAALANKQVFGIINIHPHRPLTDYSFELYLSSI